MPFSVNRLLLLRRVLKRISPGDTTTSRKGSPMEPTSTEERQARAGRNQSLFRAMNEKLNEVNEPLARVTDTFVISCECADMSCIEMLDITPDDYRSVRADPHWFIVLPDHVYPEVESVIRHVDGYVVVEKFGAGGQVAEAADSTNDGRP